MTGKTWTSQIPDDTGISPRTTLLSLGSSLQNWSPRSTQCPQAHIVVLMSWKQTQPNPTQPNPWMDPTHDQLCHWHCCTQRDLNYQQNLFISSSTFVAPCGIEYCENRCSIFLRNPANKQTTNRQTNKLAPMKTKPGCWR